jgi:hypothetical protein
MSTLVVEAIQNAAGNKLEAVQLVSSGTSTGVASLDLDISSSVFTHWDLWIDSLTPATDGAVLALRVSIDGGSSFKSGTNDYEWGGAYSTMAGSGTNQHGDAGHTGMSIFADNVLGNATNETSNARIAIFNPRDAGQFFNIVAIGTHTLSDGTRQWGSYSGHYNLSTDDVTDIQLIFESGNIADCNHRLYGYK